VYTVYKAYVKSCVSVKDVIRYLMKLCISKGIRAVCKVYIRSCVLAYSLCKGTEVGP
jgi:hypothetical protein